MPFGNGKSYNRPADAGELKGILKDVAVECYFMPGGKMEPVFLRQIAKKQLLSKDVDE